ncbi:MAG: hypothetical protein U1F67_26355 [Rubrivivax sp.]
MNPSSPEASGAAPGAARPLRELPAAAGIEIIDQRWLPHRLAWAALRDAEAVATAIAQMWLRGAPLIGAAAAYGLALALQRDAGDAALRGAAERLAATRPTAVNLRWALERVCRFVAPLPPAERAAAAWGEAARIVEEDVAANAAIGAHGFALLRAGAAARRAARPVAARADALQRGLAGHLRLGHGDGADLTRRTPPAWRSKCGWTRRARATRARASPRGSWRAPACRTA